MLDINVTYAAAIRNTLNTGRPSAPRGQPIRELIGASTRHQMCEPLIRMAGRRLNYRYAFAEAWFILTGRNDVATLVQYNSRMKAFSDDGITFFGAYGPQLLPQLDYVVDALAIDVLSRRALASIWIRNPPTITNDVPCTVSLQWVIRDGYLHCIDHMRSSDLWLGWPYDVFVFAMASAVIAHRLKVKTGICYELGELIVIAGSSHIYDRNISEAEAMLNDVLHPWSTSWHFDPWRFRSEAELLSFLKDQADTLKPMATCRLNAPI